MTLIATPQQTAGPLFGFGLLFDGSDHAVGPEAADAWTIEGRITDATGMPLQWEALVEIWNGELFARARTEDDGMYTVVVRKPGAEVMQNGAVLAPYLNVSIIGRGLNARLDTRMYFPDEAAANAADPVLSLVPSDRRNTLLARSTNVPGRLRFDIVLQGTDESVFFSYPQ